MLKKTISKSDLTVAVQESSALQVAGRGEIRTLDDFLKADGRQLGGGNVLKLAIGGVAGWLRVVEILPNQKLNKKMKGTVDVYVAELDGIQVRMPASLSFTAKAKEAKLKVGDEFAVARLEDYKSQHGRVDCHAYAIKLRPKA
jgi:hypothetical protein